MTMEASTRSSSEPSANSLHGLRISVYADGADRDQILRLAEDPQISGFTTNPTLMRQSGVRDYRSFAQDLLAHVDEKPISFEVFADDHQEMYRQAREIASWGRNVYVKIPVMNTRREPSYDLAHRLSAEGIQVNVTAVFTLKQVEAVAGALSGGVSSVISIFAGRIADTGRDPVAHMRQAVELAKRAPNASVLWASPREVLNLYQADSAGCHIITMTPDLLAKTALRDRDLDDYSHETVKMFHEDAARAGYTL
jgi:transaldolase